MSPGDVEYYRRRAATERELARVSERPEIAAIHEALARQYEALVERQQFHVVARNA